jgi:class 3 adenylate cyclase
MDERLRHLCEALEHTGWGAILHDADWKLAWVSEEAKALLGESDPGRLGIGWHVLASSQRGPWRHSITDESYDSWVDVTLPYLAYDHPDGVTGLRGLVEDPKLLERLERVEPAAPPPLWTSTLDFLQADLPPATITYVSIRHETDGQFLGTTTIYGPHIPASLLAFLVRGDENMFRRMARLFEPAPRPAAVLFADLRSSSELSRRLPSSGYFQVMREVLTAIDAEVIAHRGIVGKHVGDGVTAFFLSEDHGSDSAAARAAIDTAGRLPSAACAAAERAGEAGVPVKPPEVQLGVGTHWGAALYMGQTITGGRLEVTALGDAVNEAARFEQSAQEGEVLASKDLVECLDGDDAEILGLDIDRLRYRLLAELPGSDQKAKRDAGSLAVTDLAEALTGADEEDED